MSTVALWASFIVIEMWRSSVTQLSKEMTGTRVQSWFGWFLAIVKIEDLSRPYQIFLREIAAEILTRKNKDSFVLLHIIALAIIFSNINAKTYKTCLCHIRRKEYLNWSFYFIFNLLKQISFQVWKTINVSYVLNGLIPPANAIFKCLFETPVPRCSEKDFEPFSFVIAKADVSDSCCLIVCILFKSHPAEIHETFWSCERKDFFSF